MMPEKCRGQDSKRIFYRIFREIARAFEIPISTLLLRASPDMNLGFEKSEATQTQFSIIRTVLALQYVGQSLASNQV